MDEVDGGERDSAFGVNLAIVQKLVVAGGIVGAAGGVLGVRGGPRDDLKAFGEVPVTQLDCLPLQHPDRRWMDVRFRRLLRDEMMGGSRYILRRTKPHSNCLEGRGLW